MAVKDLNMRLIAALLLVPNVACADQLAPDMSAASVLGSQFGMALVREASANAQISDLKKQLSDALHKIDEANKSCRKD